MKRLIFLSMLICAFLSSSVYARNDQADMILNDNAGTNTEITDYALTSGSAIYSETIDLERNAGFICLLIVEDKAGGAGDVDVSIEYSIDASNWYVAYTSDLAGTLTADGNIVTALQNVTRYIIFQARPAQYARFKFDPDADSQITATLIYIVDK